MSAPLPSSVVILAQIDAVSETETHALAERVAARAQPGDILLLSGPLGAGKTAFARAFIQARQDRPEDVPSPTFTLVQTYDAPVGPIWHADLYRLGDISELWELGLLDAGSGAILLVEWPEIAAEVWPGHALRLQFETTGHDTRRITLSRADGRAAKTPLAGAFGA